jgi:hypothetical protein
MLDFGYVDIRPKKVFGDAYVQKLSVGFVEDPFRSQHKTVRPYMR